MQWPGSEPMTKDVEKITSFLIDDAFSLKTWLMNPHHITERVYNYKIWSTNGVVENTFGLMVQIFHC